jgi:hypothetical protein
MSDADAGAMGSVVTIACTIHQPRYVRAGVAGPLPFVVRMRASKCRCLHSLCACLPARAAAARTVHVYRAGPCLFFAPLSY